MLNIQHWKNWKKRKQLSIDEYSSLHIQYGLNCVRAHRHPELTYEYKKEADIKLNKTSPFNRVLRQYISKHKSELCYDNNIPLQVIEYNEVSNHS